MQRMKNLLLHKLTCINTRFIAARSYRFGRRPSISGYYVSPEWFDRRLLLDKKNGNQNDLDVENLFGTEGRNRIKNDLFNKEQQFQRSSRTKIEKIEINLEKPFFNTKDSILIMNADESTPYDCASHINELLKNRSALAVINKKIPWDMHRPLKESCNLSLIHFKHNDCMVANLAFWRSCSMILASVIQNIFKKEHPCKIISIPMSDLKNGSFVCDAFVKNLDNWIATSQEILSITSVLKDEVAKKSKFERLDVNFELAAKLFADNPYRMKEIESSIESSIESDQKNPSKTFSIYRVGNYIDLSEGPMIANTDQIGPIQLTAIHPLRTRDGHRFYRFQGIALPKQLTLNAFAFSMLRDRAKVLNSYGLQ
ncbi:39S ribosomal protein L39 [Sarcoptes scabiei]|uniref:39S ribosomal protein L39, mitochondrial n=1 Tax=Sarcoptes scabiei TaxID=52283 RepID=A0A834R1I6_SARSC|nr:39S ribosomal protein L39 [Sarcoptes scabiei]UXI16776.1 39S ribosomal protein [Sarcoptes scabiei]